MGDLSQLKNRRDKNRKLKLKDGEGFCFVETHTFLDVDWLLFLWSYMCKPLIDVKDTTELSFFDEISRVRFYETRSGFIHAFMGPLQS